jgi:hypothetical protein
MDRDSSAPSTARFAGCLPVVPLLQTLMVGSTRPTPHRYTASTARRRDTLEVPAILGGYALRGERERAARRCESKPNPLAQCRWQSQQCTARLPKVDELWVTTVTDHMAHPADGRPSTSSSSSFYGLVPQDKNQRGCGSIRLPVAPALACESVPAVSHRQTLSACVEQANELGFVQRPSPQPLHSRSIIQLPRCQRRPRSRTRRRWRRARHGSRW